MKKSVIAIILAMMMTVSCLATQAETEQKEDLLIMSAPKWYDESMSWAAKYDDQLVHDEALTHGKFITMMYECAKDWGKDVSEGEDTNILSYDDALELPEGSHAAFQWACAAGLIADEAVKLEYDRVLTRQDMTVMLYNFAKWMELDVSVGEETNILSYEDAIYLEEGMAEPFQWAFGSGVLIGNGTGYILYDAQADNAQMATVLMRLEAIAK